MDLLEAGTASEVARRALYTADAIVAECGLAVIPEDDALTQSPSPRGQLALPANALRILRGLAVDLAVPEAEVVRRVLILHEQVVVARANRQAIVFPSPDSRAVSFHPVYLTA